MTQHYFVREPTAPPRPIRINALIRGRPFRFHSDAGVFSATRVDPGTALLAEVMEVPPGARVLDLGCGYGVLGIVAAVLAPDGLAVLVDRNRRAVELARANIALNDVRRAYAVLAEGGCAFADGVFDVVLTNPPVHAGNQAVFAFIADAQRKLRPGGRFYLVGRTRRGVATFARYMQELFGNLEEVEKKSSWRVYRARRVGSQV